MKSKLTIAVLLLFTGLAIGQTGVPYKTDLNARLYMYGTSVSSYGYFGVQSSHLRYVTASGVNMYFHAGVGLGTTAPLILSSTGAVVNGTLEVTGALTQTGAVTFTELITVGTGLVADAQDGAYIGTSALQFSDLFLADGAVIALGDDGDVTLTHIADTGILLTDDSGVSTRQLQFGDAGTYVYQAADGILGLVADTEVDITVTTLDINGLADISGTLGVTGAITATGGIIQPTMTPVIWATGGSTVLATSGTDTAPTNGPRWWTEVQIPYNVTLTGIFYLIGSVGGTDSVVVDLYNNAGTLVASSYSGAGGAADIVGTAANIQSVAFTSTYAAVAGKYFVSLQFNGTTAKFRTYTIPGSPFIAATAAGTYRTAASITPGSSFTADKGPISGVY